MFGPNPLARLSSFFVSSQNYVMYIVNLQPKTISLLILCFMLQKNVGHTRNYVNMADRSFDGFKYCIKIKWHLMAHFLKMFF